jgi:hypothetical protein
MNMSYATFSNIFKSGMVTLLIDQDHLGHFKDPCLTTKALLERPSGLGSTSE